MSSIIIKKQLTKKRYQICYDTLGLQIPPIIKEDEESPQKTGQYYYLGDFFPGDSLEVIKKVSKHYTQIFDTVYRKHKDNFDYDSAALQYDKETIEKKDNIFRNYILRRFINYEEFIRALNTNFNFNKKDHPSYYYTHESFPDYLLLALGINTYSKFEGFTSKFKANPNGYKAFLAEYHNQDNKTLKDFLLNGSVPLFIPRKQMIKSTYIVGESGSGKSELQKQIIDNQLEPFTYLEEKKDNIKAYRQDNNKENIVLIEPHGDLSDQVARFAKNYDRKNIVLLDYGLSSNHTFCINPFDVVLDGQKHQKELNKLTNNIVAALSESFRDPTDRMRNLLKAYVAVLLQLPNTSILDLRDFITDDETLIEHGKRLGLTSSHRNMFANIKGKRKQTKNHLLARLEKLLGDIFLEQVLVGQASFDLQKLINNESGKLIILKLSTGQLGSKFAVSTIGKLFLGLLSGIFYNRANIPEKDRITTHIIIDEFHDFITSAIFDGLTALRKFKGYFYLASQTVGQDMNNSQLKKLLGNTQVKIVGKTDSSSQRKILDNTKLNQYHLQKIQLPDTQGRFALQIGSYPGVVFQARDNLLGYKQAMNQEYFTEIKDDVLGKYYHLKDRAEYESFNSKKNHKKRKNVKQKDDKQVDELLMDDDLEF